MTINPTELTTQLDAVIVALETELEPARRQQERDTAMHDFEAADGKWKYAPVTEKDKAEAALKEDQARRAGERLYAVGRLVIDSEPLLKDALEQAKQPPSPRESFTRMSNPRGTYTLEQELQVNILEELRHSNIDRELGDAHPAQVLAAYTNALTTGDDTVIRYIERRHARGWGWVPASRATDVDAATAAQTLHRRITKEREARVPAEYRAALDAFSRAKKVMQRAQDLYKVVARNPHYATTGA